VVHMAFWGVQLVALKEATGRLTNPKVQKPFRDEFNILRKLEHPNVVQLIGILYDPLSIVTEWVARGDLYHVLRNEQNKFSLLKLVEMMCDVAKGLAYLHSKSIIHRDIKSHNLLVSEDFNVKLADVGFSLVIDAEDRKIGYTLENERASEMAWTAVGTKGYVAPEVVCVIVCVCVYGCGLFLVSHCTHIYIRIQLDASYECQGYTGSKADVFSLAMVMWELLTRGDNPLISLGPVKYIDAIQEQKMPAMPDYCPPQLATLITQCWSFRSADRPDAAYAVGVLESLLRESHGALANVAVPLAE
jgi:serine/threonine protein kinase